MIITPTIGRVVWFYPNGQADLDAKRQPYATLVAYVHNQSSINIGGFDSSGYPIARQHIRLLQEGEVTEGLRAFCCWMPYQQAQAAKHANPSNPAKG